MGKKADTLKLCTNLGTDTQDKMDEVRKRFFELAEYVEGLGESRETNLAFTHIESACQSTIKHLCLADPEHVKKPIKGREGEVTENDFEEPLPPQAAA